MSANDLAANAMFFFERKDLDLPYYRTSPNGFSLIGWVIVHAGRCARPDPNRPAFALPYHP